MKDTYFKLIGQKTTEKHTIIVAVVPNGMLGDFPDIFEVQAVKQAPNIYIGTWPTIKIIPETMKDRTEELKGTGIGGILTEEGWYTLDQEKEDYLDIGL